jgi:hypothetical protein
LAIAEFCWLRGKLSDLELFEILMPF